LRREVGIAVGKKLLDGPDSAARVRGVERLGAIGTSEAIEALVETLEQGTALGRDMRARLTAVRVLAPHAKKDRVRVALAKEMADAGADRTPEPELGPLLRDTAALALARSGDKRALDLLVNALVVGGGAGEAAARALRAAPPASLSPLLDNRKGMPAALCAFLGELGDLRALGRLRALLRDQDVAVRAAAAVSLAKLGDETPLGLARGWVFGAEARRPPAGAKAAPPSAPSDARLARAGTEVLVRLGAPDAPRAVNALLASDTGRTEGVRMALLAPSPALADALVTAMPRLPEDEALRAVVALGRAGGPVALGPLAGLMMRAVDRPAFAGAAASALAQMPDERARLALEAAATARSSPELERLIARAGVVRALALGDPPSRLESDLRRLAASRDATHRAVGVFGLVATGAEHADSYLERACADRLGCEATTVHAIARGALARGPDALASLLELLERLARTDLQPVARAGAAPSPLAAGGAASSLLIAAGVGLLVAPSGGELATARLAEWAEGGGPLAPLAARALPSRDDEVVRPRIKRLLEGTDPVVRAHAALGLARDPEPDAASLLASTYRFEEDASVRRAVVRALSLRNEVQRRAVLELARDLDPDESVRALATSALAGRRLEPTWGKPCRGAPVAWIEVDASEPPPALPASRAASRARAMVALAIARGARVVRADGLAAPVVADPDGVLLVPGMTLGPSGVQLAPSAAPSEAAAAPAPAATAPRQKQ
jgi:HEAT repeat protein